MSRTTLIVGIGSHHGDDRFGWLTVESLAKKSDERFDVRMARSPSDLLNWTAGVKQLVICDACRGTAASGTIRRWSWPAADIEQTVFSGTHDLSLPIVLNLAAELGRLPAEVIVWAAEAKRFVPGDTSSSEIAAAATEVARRIRVEFGGK